MGITRKWRAVLLLVGLATFIALAARAADVGEGTKARPGGMTGQQIIVPNPTTGDTVRYLLRGTNGSAWTLDRDRDRDQRYFATDIISRIMPAGLWPPNGTNSPTADSSAMIPTPGWNHMTLWIYPTCTGATTTGDCDSLQFVYLALQVRGGAFNNGDSLGAHPRIRLRRPATAGNPDTLGGFAGRVPSSTGVGITDSLQTRADPWTEQIIAVPVAPEYVQGGRGYAITLVDPSTGEPWKADYTGIRIRYIAGYDMKTTQARWGAGQAMPINLRCDLEGWR